MKELYSAVGKVEEKKTAGKNSDKVFVKDERDFLPEENGNPLSSLIVKPSAKVRFEGQDPEEEILMIVRAHPITNIRWIVIALVWFFSPFVLRFFPLLMDFPVKYQIVFVIIWYLVLLMYVFERFLSWFFNLTIITDERIVDVDFLNLTTKRISDAEIEKIQDVSFTNAGAIGTIFNYGNVTVQTAAEIPEFVFENVPRPAQIAKVLQQLRLEEKTEVLEGRIR